MAKGEAALAGGDGFTWPRGCLHEGMLHQDRFSEGARRRLLTTDAWRGYSSYPKPGQKTTGLRRRVPSL